MKLKRWLKITTAVAVVIFIISLLLNGGDIALAGSNVIGLAIIVAIGIISIATVVLILKWGTDVFVDNRPTKTGKRLRALAQKAEQIFS